MTTQPSDAALVLLLCISLQYQRQQFARRVPEIYPALRQQLLLDELRRAGLFYRGDLTPAGHVRASQLIALYRMETP